jgi:glycosyltransferase involved in cell wall biosynthesis
LSKETTLLLLITKMEGAGAQKIMLETARYFQHAPGFRVVAVCLYDQNYAQEAFQKYGVRVLDLRMKKAHSRLPLLANVLRTLKGCVQLYRLLRSEPVQLLQTYDFYANAIGALVGRLARIPIIVMSQRVGYAKRWRRWVDRRVSRRVDRVTAVSEHVREFCIKSEGMLPGQVVVVRNGIDLEAFVQASDRVQTRGQLGIDDATFLVGTVGRLSKEKGHRILIQAASLVLTSISNVKFIVVGQGPDLVELRTLVEQLQLSEVFIFTGHVADVRSLLDAVDLYVHPSLWEGMPNAVLEAMACARPIVATSVGGTLELLVDRESGLLVPPGDAPALAAAIIRILTHTEESAQLGGAARERVASQFSLDSTMAATARLYESLLVKARRD